MRDRRFWTALLLLVLFSGVVMGYLWWGKFHYYHRQLLLITDLVALLSVLAGHVLFSDSRRELGLRLDNLGPAAAGFGLLTGVLAAAILVAAFLTGARPSIPTPFPWVYVGWAGLQQYVLQNFLWLRAENITRRRQAATVLAAVLFGLYHLPNTRLVVLSVVAAMLWCRLFRRRPNLLAAWASQAVVGCLLIFFLKDSALQQMSVGRPGFRYEHFGGGVLVAGGVDGDGAPFVATLPGHDIGVSARLRVRDPNGRLRFEETVFSDRFSGQLAVGDLGPTPGDEIVVAPGPAGGDALAVIYSAAGQRLAALQAPSLSNGYGAYVEADCGELTISAGPAPGGRPAVGRLSPAGGFALLERPLPELVNGVRARRLCGSEDPRWLLWPAPLAVNPARFYLDDGSRFRPHQAFEGFTFGLNLTLLRTAGGPTRIAVAPGPLEGYPALVRIFDLEGRRTGEFRIPDAGCGANLGAVDADGDGTDEVIVAEGIGCGGPPRVWISTSSGEVLYQWLER